MSPDRAAVPLKVTLVPSHVVTSVRPGMITGHHSYHAGHERSWPADSIVLVTQRRSRTGLYEKLTADPAALRGHDIDRVLRIGDCVEPRVIAESVFDGHRLAREIDSPDPASPLPFIREQRILGWREKDYDGELRGLIPLTPVSRPRSAVAPG